MIKTPSYVIDSCALLAYFFAESGFEKIVELLMQAQKGEIILYMNIVKYGEIYYILKKNFREDDFEKTISAIKTKLPFKLVSSDLDDVEYAASCKANGGLAYPDCFVLATAKKFQSKIITKDLEFKRYENEFEFVWVE